MTTTDSLVRLSHLDTLESEAIHIMREVAAELERPVLLFSGGKDSIVLLRLAEKAFRPGRFPFPIMHVDTGHNFQEAIEYRDRRVAELGERLVIASVQESIDKGRVVEQTGPRASRNQLQTTTLLDAIEEHGFDAAIGGARRDEERSRAMGIADPQKIYSSKDLASGDGIIFAATGVTDGTLMRGVRFFGDGTRTSSIVMQSDPPRIRFIDTIHVEQKRMVRIRF